MGADRRRRGPPRRWPASFESAGEGLAASKSARNLRAAGLLDDVRYCARESVLDVVPTVVDVDDGVALITA